MGTTKSSTSHEESLAADRYRLYPNESQEHRLSQWSGAVRALHNAALEQRRVAYRSCGKSVGVFEQCRDLTETRKEIDWLGDVPAQVAQQGIRDLDAGFKRFFGKSSGYPKFKKKGNPIGLRFPQGVRVRRINRRWGEVYLAKLGWVRFRWSRKPAGAVKHATLKRDALGWHVSLCVELDRKPEPPNGGPGIGVDRGVVALAATSDGEQIKGDFWRPAERQRKLKLERKLARQKKGSNRRRMTVKELAKLRARIARRRLDTLHKFSCRIAKEHALVVIEDLDSRSMTRSAKGTLETPGKNVKAKAGLNREILERGWGALARQLDYKCGWYGSKLAKVDPRFTSQTCFACGEVDSKSRESQARFCCTSCGHEANADTNAARVILARGHELTAGGPPVAARGGLVDQTADETRTSPEEPLMAASGIPLL